MDIPCGSMFTEKEKIKMAAIDFESKFHTQVMEDTEMFLFKTIQPFCETITERRIEKKELVEALTKHIPKARVYDHGIWLCPSCSSRVHSDQKYCDFCGQHMEKLEV